MSDGGNLTLSIFCLLLSDHRSDANTALQIKINSADLRPQADDSTVCTSLLLTCVMASDDSTVCTSLLLTCVMASDARLLLWFALGVMYHHALRVLGLSKSCRIPQDVAEL